MNSFKESDLINILNDLNKIKESLPSNWILISPDGKVFNGPIEAITRVVMQNHPINQYKPLTRIEIE